MSKNKISRSNGYTNLLKKLAPIIIVVVLILGFSIDIIAHNSNKSNYNPTKYTSTIIFTSTLNSTSTIATTPSISQPHLFLILTNYTGGRVSQGIQTNVLTPSSFGLAPLTQQEYQQVISINSKNPNFGAYGNQEIYSGPGVYEDIQGNNYIVSNPTQYLAVNPTGGKVSYYAQIDKYGTIINISAIPNQGYIFDGWNCEGNNCYSGNDTNITIKMTNNITETANFKLKSGFYYLNVLSNTSTGNLIGSGVYTNGTIINISETPPQGYVFVGWACHGWGCYTGSGKNFGVFGSSWVNITMRGNITEIADYQSGAPSQGTCEGCGQYPSTTTQITTTIPASAYSFNSSISQGALTVGQTIDNQGDNFTLSGVVLTNGVPEANITVVCYHQGYPVPSYSCPSGACQWYTGYIGNYWIYPTSSYNLDYGNACDGESIYVGHVNWSPNVSDRWATVQIG